MFLARVVGNLVAPVQHPFYDGRKVLVVRRTDPDGKLRGPDRVVVDRVGAGLDELVLVMEEGSSARDLFDEPHAPVRSIIVGIVDQVELDGETVVRQSD